MEVLENATLKGQDREFLPLVSALYSDGKPIPFGAYDGRIPDTGTFEWDGNSGLLSPRSQSPVMEKHSKHQGTMAQLITPKVIRPAKQYGSGVHLWDLPKAVKQSD
jgi:hypothetical protein